MIVATYCYFCNGFDRSQLCTYMYEVSGKFCYLHTHCTSNFFVFYAVTCKSFFWKALFLSVCFEIKFFYSDSNHAFHYMRENFKRKYTSPTKSKIYSFDAISGINSSLYILFIIWLHIILSHYINIEADKWYHMPSIITIKGIHV